jgi:hypothetical protein
MCCTCLSADLYLKKTSGLRRSDPSRKKNNIMQIEYVRAHVHHEYHSTLATYIKNTIGSRCLPVHALYICAATPVGTYVQQAAGE